MEDFYQMYKREMVLLENRCIIYDRNGNVLMLEDEQRKHFPGGEVRLGESFAESIIRVVQEQTGLTIEAPKLCALEQCSREGEPTIPPVRDVTLVYRADCFSGELDSSKKIKPIWVKRSELHGDNAFRVQLVEDSTMSGEWHVRWQNDLCEDIIS